MSNSQRDRAGNLMGASLSSVPEYIKYKYKKLGQAILKKKVKDVILTNPTINENNVVKALFNSTNFIDPQSVRLCFTMRTSANGGNAHLHPNAGLHAMIKSLKVSHP